MYTDLKTKDFSLDKYEALDDDFVAQALASNSDSDSSNFIDSYFDSDGDYDDADDFSAFDDIDEDDLKTYATAADDDLEIRGPSRPHHVNTIDDDRFELVCKF